MGGFYMNLRRSILIMGLGAGAACLPLIGSGGGILSPMAGTVDINGQSITAGSAILPGDLVTTSADGSARMVLPGGSVIAASNTSFRMANANGAGQIRLQRGLVKVTGPLPVALNTRTVIPATVGSRFNVYDLSGKAYVEALAGKVTVKSAGHSYAVPAGRAVSFPDSAAAAAAYAPSGPPAGLAKGVAAMAGVATGVVVHEGGKCSTCTGTVSHVASPYQ